MSCRTDNYHFTGVIFSGHGQCVDGTCVCDEGWTGLGDFQRISGYGYPIDKLSIMYWSMVNLIATCLGSCYVLAYIVENRLLYVKRFTENKARLCFSCPSMNAGFQMYSIGKLYDQEKLAVGGSPVASIGVSIALFGGMLAFSSYITIVLKFFRGYSKIIVRREKIIQLANILIKYLTPCCIVCGIQVLGF